MTAFPTIVPLGDDAVLVTLADAISWDVGERVRSLAERIRERRLESVTDVVPAYTTVAVYFDSSRIPFDSVRRTVESALDARADAAPTNSVLIEIPVRYDGPDLAEVAERTGLTVDAVIERHSGRTYRAYMAGFVPGFVYLGDLDESLVLPRRSAPRVRVAAGSVAIAGAQTAVYPLATAGGWHLIGSTTTVMFDPRRDPPTIVRAGDHVRFVRVDS